MSSILLIDDHLLLRILLDDEPAAFQPTGAALYTTGLWYHRLCRALTNPAVSGVMSGSLGSADPTVGAKAIAAITELPESISLISLRDLSWPMAALLADGIRLNLMSLEALAAAERLDAEICLAAADENPTLLAAAKQRRLRTRLVDG